MAGIPFPWKTKAGGRPNRLRSRLCSMLSAQVDNPTGVAVLHRESAGTVRGFPACISDS
jgi:hypothetical protein